MVREGDNRYLIDFTSASNSSAVMRDERCTRLYKYRSLSGEFGRPAIKQALLHCQLWWQSPLEFNDPFDCLPTFHFGDNDEQRWDFHERAAEAAFADQPEEVWRAQAMANRQMPVELMEERLRIAWNDWMAGSGITCFSEAYDHPLMWGHYADSHKGVCLVFDEVANDEKQWFAFPVNYQEERPRVDLTQFNDRNVMLQALFLKSSHWSYECEQRMFQWRVPPGYRPFPPELLKGIILGAKISADDEAFVRGLLARRPALPIFRAVIDPAEFKLNMKAAHVA